MRQPAARGRLGRQGLPARCGAVVLSVLVALAGVSCSSGQSGSEPPEQASGDMSIVELDDWAETFQRFGATGTFALRQLGGDETVVHDPDRAASRESPASTFKILNSLVALETGTLQDVDEIVPWDGVDSRSLVANRHRGVRRVDVPGAGSFDRGRTDE